MSYLDTGENLVNVDGMMVDADVLRVGEALREYDDRLVVFGVDPNKADWNEAPFIIAELCPDGKYRRILETWELNQSVVDRIKNADTHVFDVQARIDYVNAEARREGAQRYKDKQLEVQDLVAGIIKNKKSSYSWTDIDTKEKVTMYEDGRPVKRES